jgi:hypothetical protein
MFELIASKMQSVISAISHFYSVINELRRRVSTLEKKLKPLNGGNGGSKSPEAAAGKGTTTKCGGTG